MILQIKNLILTYKMSMIIKIQGRPKGELKLKLPKKFGITTDTQIFNFITMRLTIKYTEKIKIPCL